MPDFVPPGEVKALEAFASALFAHRRVLVVSHANPDGDAISSMLAAAHICRQKGLDVSLYSSDPVPATLKFLPGSGEISQEVDYRIVWPCVLIVDCAHVDRVGVEFASKIRYEKAMILDHHVPDNTFGDLVYNDTAAAATGEVIYRLAAVAGVGFTPEIATCIFTGISTDTGGFRFSNTNSFSLGVAAKMAEAGANGYSIAHALYEQQSAARLRLLGEALSRMEISADGVIGSIVVTDEMLRRTGATMAMIDGFIDYPRSVQGVRVAVQYREAGLNDCKVSFRSHGSVDVQALAARFGGGGHRNASGCRVSGALKVVQGKVEQAIRELLLQE